MKVCSKCRYEKPVAEFYADLRTPDGFKAQCKPCHCEGSIRTRDLEKKRKANQKHMRSKRVREPEVLRERERNYIRPKDERVRARQILNSAVISGVVIKPKACAKCECVCRLAAHHGDYSKPLEVEWLCYECHGKEHRHAA